MEELELNYVFPWNWWSLDWASAFVLWLLPLFIAIEIWRHWRKPEQALVLAFKKGQGQNEPMAWLRFIPQVLRYLFLLFLLLALARPQTNHQRVERWSEGIDIVLVLDISLSMKAQDFSPNRLNAAKSLSEQFIDGRYHDRIGYVIFAGEALPISPLTNDYSFLKSMIEQVNFNSLQVDGTAIGDALTSASTLLKDSKSKSKVVVLLSDGENTAGVVDPITAANMCHSYTGAKIYTIAVGDDLSSKSRDNPVDVSSLQQIAEIGKGKFYTARNNESLKKVFSEIDQLEKVKIKENRFSDQKDYYREFLWVALALFLVWMLCKASFMSHLLSD